MYIAEAGHNHWNIDIKKPIRSTEWDSSVRFTFENTTNDIIDVCWHDWYGNKQCDTRIQPRATERHNAWATSPFSIQGVDNSAEDYKLNGQYIHTVTVFDQNKTLQIDKIYRSKVGE